ncbi:hypothetical protein LRS74_30125 [Streptomyces sp. LX-29]|uniref:hypothetical protein n=1 Tax=Streptomyces sp. LX-29 TaxID=2900152 RepID=UPI00240D8349|nr:hypothetical protein [Streptomyces sp. LX-29]WFB10829.1 hypothetical protein LRS74_30125 [Streptomyces sp. LX-29]
MRSSHTTRPAGQQLRAALLEAAGPQTTPVQEAWRDYLTHASACPKCRNSAACPTGTRRLGSYKETLAEARKIVLRAPHHDETVVVGRRA